jgi:thiamine biosynthesis lipoprotein
MAKSRRERHMGGHSTITLVGGSPELHDSCFALAHRCESLWSRFLPTSDITMLNWAEGAVTEVDPLTVRLATAMLAGFARTGGDFDPTLLPQLLAAGYVTSRVDPDRSTTLPDSARAPGEIGGMVIENDTISLPYGTTLDPGGIGKGLAADLICEFALAEGARGVMAEIGGDVVVAGEAPEAQGWRIGLEDPHAEGEYAAIVRLGSGAIVTSSQLKRRWGSGVDERHHLMDASTGTSTVGTADTVSVIATHGWYAETLAKPGFLRPTADYLAWLPTVGAAGSVIDRGGTLHISSNWLDYA